MNRKRKQKLIRQIEEVYSNIPASIQCKGLCQGSCGPIAMTEVEWERIVDKTGSEPTVDNFGTCSLLVDGKCSVYEIRPLICRLWGLAKEMECPFGCVPNPDYLSKTSGIRILALIEKVSGNKTCKSTLKELENVLND